jgi:hypothetical protein
MCNLTTTLGMLVVDMHRWYIHSSKIYMKNIFKRLRGRVLVMSFWLFGN